MVKKSESDLIKGFKSGDVSCFKELFDFYKDMVFNVCLKFLENRNDAEDSSQEIFIKIYHSIDNFKEESKFSTWLYRISVNHCLNFIRKRKRVEWISLKFLFEDNDQISHFEVPVTSTDAHDILIQKESAEFINKAINSLPERQKTAILLSKFEELPYDEIASIMDCSVSSVESLLFRAKQNLSQKLSKYFNQK